MGSFVGPIQCARQVKTILGGAVGTLRLDLLDGAWQMSWTVAPEHRGRGVGAAIVQLAVTRMTGERVFAEIKAANLASRRIAEKSGFRLRGKRDGMLVYWRCSAPSLSSG